MARAPAPELLEQLLATLRIGPNDVVLDVGTGTGSLIGHIESLQPAEVIACDLSSKMLEIVGRKYSHAGNLRLLHADARELPLADSSVDVVICNGVYPHFADRLATLGELHRIARPGARIAVSHFAGRETINAIHSRSEDRVIRHDLLEPGAEVAGLLRQSGFAVTAVVDTESFFLVAGRKTDD